MLKNQVSVKVHDPLALENFKKIFQNKINYCKTTIECIKNSDCCVIMTGWDEYSKLKVNDFQKNMSTVNIVDAQRIFDKKKFEELLLKISKKDEDYVVKKENLKKLNYQNTWNNVNQKILKIINEN